MRYLFVSVLLVAFTACTPKPKIEKLTKGKYRAELQVDKTETLPFIFEVKNRNELTIFNAEERIAVDEIEYKNDSVYIKTPVFEGVIIAKLDNNTLKGRFFKEGLNRTVPFTAQKSETRFPSKDIATTLDVTGNWETVFSPNTEEDRYLAKGVFTQNGNIVTGTFRTETGDYRYLEGVLQGNQLKLSTFDGAHAFLFTATVTDSTLTGQFYSGNHWKEPFTAKRNPTFELKNSNELTYLKEGYTTIDFEFPDANGTLVSLSNKRFKNKVVLVQIMGTWCPNCLDESKYYAEFYKANKNKDLEIVALAFEYAKTEEKAFANIKRLTSRVGVTYPVLLAQTGTTSKQKANEKLPMLNHVLSYPTTLFIDKTGTVRKIHTGFNGPATGEKFTEFKNEFTTFVGELLEE